MADLSEKVFADPVVHRDTTAVSASPLHLVTNTRQWAYAATYPFLEDDGVMRELVECGARVMVDLSVLRGRVGVGITNRAGDAFLVEKFADAGRRQTSLLLASRAGAAGAVVLRNVSDAGASEFVLHALRVESLRGSFAYPVHVAARTFDEEAIPPAGDAKTVFDTAAARAINSARLAWLDATGLVTAACRVLDAGAGVGHFLPYYLERGCHVVALDGRPENVAELRRRFPDVDARVADVQRVTPESLGTFDLIHCFGLLYHLESPIAALRLFREICVGTLVLETMVCDSSRPVCVLADETKAASQALDGLGCRPSPAFLALALNRVGFGYVYGANPPPRHEDFQFTWQDNLDTTRDNHPLRCVFVASDKPLENTGLFPVID